MPIPETTKLPELNLEGKNFFERLAAKRLYRSASQVHAGATRRLEENNDDLGAELVLDISTRVASNPSEQISGSQVLTIAQDTIV